jgi:hypothetical protein
MARKDRINQKPFHNPPQPSFHKGGKGGLLCFDVNITMKKVNDKNPLKPLVSAKKKACPFLGTGLLYLLLHTIGWLLPITIVGEPLLDIDSIKLLKRPEYLFIFLINLF